MSDLIDNVLSGDDGFFTIDFKDGEAYLTVHPPSSGGNSVEVKDVVNRLKLLKIPPVSHTKIETIIRQSAAVPLAIGPWPEGSLIRGKIHVSSDDEGMLGYVQVTKGRMQEKDFIKSDVMQALLDKGIQQGILENEIETIFKDERYGEEVLIARGREPEHGADGDIEFKFPEAPLYFEENEQGRVDYRDVGKIKSVEAETILATVKQPTAGEDGYNIFGVDLPARPGRSAQLMAGRNTYISPDKRAIVAEIDGYISYAMGTVHIEDICRLPQVNFETGNVEFNGTVIAGKVENGFKIAADGSIRVQEPMERVYLYAGHNIHLQGGVRGKDHGIIEAAGDIVVKYAENTTLIAGNNVHVSDGVIGCNVMANEDLIVDGPRGDIMGGQCICGRRMVVNRLGAKVETKTEVFLGIPPAVIQELASIKKEYESNLEVLGKILLSLGPKNTSEENTDPEAAEKKQKLQTLKNRYETKLESLQEQMDMLAYSYEPNPEASLVVHEEIYPGVKINMGKTYRTFRGRSTKGPVEIYWNDGEIGLRNVTSKTL